MCHGPQTAMRPLADAPIQKINVSDRWCIPKAWDDLAKIDATMNPVSSPCAGRLDKTP